ncbi:hypothetical protein CGLO_16864 [Colletotrichum gloeosporioides Cg-14]|uniref:Uncharacterized protein n=1 Tax=Colletotrichum gloeosporioides (strain Cg-14) TaxID=1237896 RepID=T0L7T9_COLGC|nr:hypothetical protein CGLO_16864 [Colletotrichum gloeosporioides Cg-14]
MATAEASALASDSGIFIREGGGWFMQRPSWVHRRRMRVNNVTLAAAALLAQDDCRTEKQVLLPRWQ